MTTKKKLYIAGAIIILIIGIGLSFFSQQATIHIFPGTFSNGEFDGKNATISIEEEPITLVNGVSVVEAAPGSASKITTTYFGNEAKGDLNGDGRADTAFLVKQETGGTGVYYYAIVALNTKKGYVLTNAFLIGDRIAPQSTEINESAKELHVNYAERKRGEPMTAQPSVGAVLLLKINKYNVLEGLMK